MTLSLGDALTILGIVASFVGAVAVGAVAVGGERKRIDGLAEKVDAMKDHETRIVTVERDLHAHKGAANVADLRIREALDEHKQMFADLQKQMQAIALSNARIEAALNKE